MTIHIHGQSGLIITVYPGKGSQSVFSAAISQWVLSVIIKLLSPPSHYPRCSFRSCLGSPRPQLGPSLVPGADVKKESPPSPPLRHPHQPHTHTHYPTAPPPFTLASN